MKWGVETWWEISDGQKKGSGKKDVVAKSSPKCTGIKEGLSNQKTSCYFKIYLISELLYLYIFADNCKWEKRGWRFLTHNLQWVNQHVSSLRILAHVALNKLSMICSFHKSMLSLWVNPNPCQRRQVVKRMSNVKFSACQKMSGKMNKKIFGLL